MSEVEQKERKSPAKQIDSNDEKNEKKNKNRGQYNQNRNNSNRESKPYRQKKEKKDKIVVTLETEIPELPKKSQRLQKPDEEQYKKQNEQIQAEIDDHYSKLHHYIDDIKKQINENKLPKDSTPTKELLMAKISLKKKLYEEFNFEKDSFNQRKDSIEDLFNQAQKYRQKMKKVMKRDELESELKALKEKQEYGQLSMQEEKTIIKQINDIEKSLPLAVPLESLEVEIEKLKKEKDEFKKKMNKAYEKIAELKNEIGEYQQDLDNQKREKSETINQLNPLIETKKEEYKRKIDELKKSKRELTQKYHEDWDNYEKQQEEIKNIEFMTKIKKRLQREALLKKQEEEEKKAFEEEKAKIKELAYQEDIDLCDLLIDYCNSLNPRFEKKSEQSKQQNAGAQVDLNQVLNNEEWKRENCTVIKSKKDQDIDDNQAKKGKKYKKSQKEKKEENKANENAPLNHQLDVLGYFDHVKVNPPLFVNRIEETVKILQEKKTYFVQLSEKSLNAEQEQEQEKEKESKPEKQEKQPKKQRQVGDMDDEEFPSM